MWKKVFSVVTIVTMLFTLFIVIDISSRIKKLKQEITKNERAMEENEQVLSQIEKVIAAKKIILKHSDRLGISMPLGGVVEFAKFIQRVINNPELEKEILKTKEAGVSLLVDNFSKCWVSGGRIILTVRASEKQILNFLRTGKSCMRH